MDVSAAHPVPGASAPAREGHRAPRGSGGRRRALGAGAVTFAVALVAVVGLAAWVEADAEARARERFDTSAAQATQTIERSLQGILDQLTGVGAFMDANPAATPADFERFVEGSDLFGRQPSLAGVLYLLAVEPGGLEEAFEVLQESHPGITPFLMGEARPDRVHLVLTQYVPGSVDLQFPLGAEVSPIESISEVLAVAGPQGSAAAGSFQDDPLLQEIAIDTDFEAIDQLLELDFFLGVPVRPPSGPGSEPGAPPEGWLAAPVTNFADVLGGAASGLPDELGLALEVALVAPGVDEAVSRAAERPGSAGPRSGAWRERQARFEVDGVEFTLVVWGGAEPTGRASGVVLVGGFLTAVLAGLLVFARVRSRQRERALARTLVERDQFRRSVLDSVAEPMVVLDGAGSVLATNPAWRAMRGHDEGTDGTEDPDLGRSYLEALAAQARGGLQELSDGFARVGDRDEAVELDVPIEGGRGHRWYSVRITPLVGAEGGAVVVHADITERKRSEAALALRASHDDLTGLLNRSAMEEEIARALQRARVAGSGVGLLFVDLDGFKEVNDVHGHAVGDDVLRAVARRIASAVRTSDRVSRFGGDEFVVLVAPVGDRREVEATARRLLDALESPVGVGDLALAVGASIGVAVVDAPLGTDPGSLVALADRAMYQAKQAGGMSFVMA